MILNPFSILSVVMSTSIAFFSLAWLVEKGFVLFRLKNPRIRAQIRLIPFFSLLVDLFFKKFSVGNYFNPLSCDSCVQKWLLAFFPELKEYLYKNQISLVNYLGSYSQILAILSILFLFLSLLFIFHRMSQLFSLYKSLNAKLAKSVPISKQISNPFLTATLVSNDVKILVSEGMTTPAAVYKNIIVIPKNLVEAISIEELEAIIAHELEHLRCKDPILRLFCRLISTLFWWMPIDSWIKKVEQEQEVACDESVVKYGIDNLFFAEALVKVTRSSYLKEEVLCLFATKSPFSKWRLEQILGINPLVQERITKLSLFAMAFGALVLLICMLT